jgi:hypothetical protein
MKGLSSVTNTHLPIASMKHDVLPLQTFLSNVIKFEVLLSLLVIIWLLSLCYRILPH